MKLKIITIILAFLFLFTCNENKENHRYMAIKLSDINGKQKTLADFKGKYIILDAWASWCEPCKEAVPVVERIKKSLENENFIVLGINTDTDLNRDKIIQSSKELGMTYPSLLDNKLKLADTLSVTGIPAFFILDPSGNIIYRQDGLVYNDYTTIMAFIYKKLGKEKY